MQITELEINNVLGVRHLDLPITAPVVLFAGPNGAGKSSTREAVHMALLGAPSVELLKQDYGALVSHGAKTGNALIKTTAGEADFLVPAGKGQTTLPLLNREALACVLDAKRFGRMTTIQRREFLFDLTGLTADPAQIAARLTKKGHSAARVGEIRTMLVSGFDAACKAATDKATEARGAWKATTGENYGAKKAEDWQAEAPPVDLIALESLKGELAEYVESLEAGQMQLGAAEADNRRAREASTTLEGLREKAELVERRRQKLEKDTVDLTTYRARAEDFKARAGTDEPSYPCPHCHGLVKIVTKEFNPHLSLTHLEPFDGVIADQEAHARLPVAEQHVTMMENAVKASQRDLDEAVAAANQLEALKSADLISIKDTTQLEADLTRWKVEKARIEGEIRAIEDAQRKADQAEETTQKAAAHHADVVAWKAIADALAPDGIPAEMLAEALRPINRRLLDTASATNWPVVQIGADMGITVDQRRYGEPFTCESHNWRADAMITEAIASVSGLRLFALDRIDVLDLLGRVELINWIDDLAYNGDVDTVLLFGTLKEPPKGLPDTIQVVWMGKDEPAALKSAA